MRHPLRRCRAAPVVLFLFALSLALLCPAPVRAVPKADHVRLDVAALRLCVNDYSVRYQLKVVCTISSSEDGGLERVKEAELTVSSPDGAAVAIKPRSVEISPKRFKAATAKLLFKAIEDSSSKAISNVPTGFLTHDGEYRATLKLRGETYGARFKFLAPVGLAAQQSGQPVKTFSLKDEDPLDVFTTPSEFGPVYYKRQDFTNFFFMLNNMDEALESKDFHTEIESPMYFFQVRVGSSDGGPTRLLDPGMYIEGHQEFLIRSDMTSTPLRFSQDEFSPGDVVIIDFMRQDTLEPNAGLAGPEEGFSGLVVTQNRVVYALAVETAPTAQELGSLSAAAEADEPRR